MKQAQCITQFEGRLADAQGQADHFKKECESIKRSIQEDKAAKLVRETNQSMS
jgi:hypothetical protein